MHMQPQAPISDYFNEGPSAVQSCHLLRREVIRGQERYIYK